MKIYDKCMIFFTKKFLQYPDASPSTNLKKRIYPIHILWTNLKYYNQPTLVTIPTHGVWGAVGG
jgi:hypothetical protein